MSFTLHHHVSFYWLGIYRLKKEGENFIQMIILSVEHVKVHSNLLMYYVQEMTNSILVIDYNNIISIKGDRNIC
jgi:hypothetical protein